MEDPVVVDIGLLAFEQALVHSGLDVDLLTYEQVLVQDADGQPGGKRSSFLNQADASADTSVFAACQMVELAVIFLLKLQSESRQLHT